MCLIVNKVETERLKKELPDTIKVYKVVHKLDGGYYSFYQNTPYRLNEYVHAQLTQEFVRFLIERDGVHAFLDLSDAHIFIKNNYKKSLVILECAGKKEDMIGVGLFRYIGRDKCQDPTQDVRQSIAFTKLLPLREIKHESCSGITKYLQEVY